METLQKFRTQITVPRRSCGRAATRTGSSLGWTRPPAACSVNGRVVRALRRREIWEAELTGRRVMGTRGAVGGSIDGDRASQTERSSGDQGRARATGIDCEKNAWRLAEIRTLL